MQTNGFRSLRETTGLEDAGHAFYGCEFFAYERLAWADASGAVDGLFKRPVSEYCLRR